MIKVKKLLHHIGIHNYKKYYTYEPIMNAPQLVFEHCDTCGIWKNGDNPFDEILHPELNGIHKEKSPFTKSFVK